MIGATEFSTREAFLDYIDAQQNIGHLDVYRAKEGGGSLVIKWDNDTSLTVSASATKADVQRYGWETFETLDEVFADPGNDGDTGASIDPDSVGWL